MIESERQRQVSLVMVTKLEATLATLLTHGDLLAIAERDGLASQVSDVAARLADYEATRAPRLRRVYVAGPFRAASGWSVEQNVRRAEAVGLEVAEEGAVAVVPHAMYRHFNGVLPDEYWLEATLDLLRACHGVLLVDGWERSVGARGELEEARRLGLALHVHWDASPRSWLDADGVSRTRDAFVKWLGGARWTP